MKKLIALKLVKISASAACIILCAWALKIMMTSSFPEHAALGYKAIDVAAVMLGVLFVLAPLMQLILRRPSHSEDGGAHAELESLDPIPTGGVQDDPLGVRAARRPAKPFARWIKISLCVAGAVGLFFLNAFVIQWAVGAIPSVQEGTLRSMINIASIFLGIVLFVDPLLEEFKR